MSSKLAHHVMFARSLAMTSTLALQACSGSTDAADQPASTAAATSSAPSTTSAASTTTGGSSTDATSGGGSGGAAPVVADAGSASDPDASAPPDAPDAGHLSGPLPPPELPRSLALA